MRKSLFYYNKIVNENEAQKVLTQFSIPKNKSVVDINILLNRVKLAEKKETKKKIIFFSFIVIGIILFGTFISIIK